MADDDRTPQTPFLTRWSQRKLAASRDAEMPVAKLAADVAVAPVVAQPPPPTERDAVSPPLPPVESLSFESDYTAFLQPNVDESVKRQALKKLFADPRFNVMDGLDVYIDDYGKFEPLSAELVAQLNHAKFLFDPPKTRINDQGYAEDVPDEPPDEPRPEAESEAVGAAMPLEPLPAPNVEDETSVALTASPDPPVALPMLPAAQTQR